MGWLLPPGAQPVKALSLLLFMFSCASRLQLSVAMDLPTCNLEGLPFVRSINQMKGGDCNRPGLSHITISGAVHHGNTQTEVWLQTFAKGASTPIHRHANEEVFLVLRGQGVLLHAGVYPDETKPVQNSGPGATPGEPEEVQIRQNMTFTIPPNQVHLIGNADSEEPLQLMVFVAKPPVHIYMYPRWEYPHRKAYHAFPYLWDQHCP